MYIISTEQFVRRLLEAHLGATFLPPPGQRFEAGLREGAVKRCKLAGALRPDSVCPARGICSATALRG